MMSIVFDIRVVHAIHVNETESVTPRRLLRVQSRPVRRTYGLRSWEFAVPAARSRDAGMLI